MPDVDHDIRSSLERLTEPTGSAVGTDALWGDLVARRRRRRVRNRAVVVLPLVIILVVGVSWLAGSDDGPSDVAARGGDASDESGGTGSLRVENTQVVGNGPLVGGTERVVIEFNEPLPAADPRYVADITSAAASVGAASGIVYTTQGPDTTHVCESVHGVPATAVGSVDLLIPARWFADGEDAHTGPVPETVDEPAKFVVCGPHDGYIQYAIWAPVSADPADVTVTVSPDRTSISVQITSTGGAVLDPVAGQGVVAAFLDHLRAGDLEAAAEEWTGYPEVGPDSAATDRLPYIEALMADPTFARILVSGTTTTLVAPATTGAIGAQVVTVLDARSDDMPPAAIAFLTALDDEGGEPGDMWIQRLPAPADGATAPVPGAGSYVAPGEELVIPGVPVEGGARAFLNGTEVPVDVDHQQSTMTIVVPEDARGDIAVTLAIATPELPDVRAFAVTVRR